MSRTLPTRFEVLASEIANRVAPLLADRVAQIVADRYGELPPLLDVAGAARYLSADEETVRRWARRGDIPCIRIGRGSKPALRFDPEALREGFQASDATQDDVMRRDAANTRTPATGDVSVAGAMTHPDKESPRK